MCRLLYLILGQVKNGKLEFKPIRILRFRIWGDWTGIEEKFEMTFLLEEATKLSVATVAEVSQIALSRVERRGQGIWAVLGNWKSIFKMTMIHEDQIPALISCHLLENRDLRHQL
jgi:hypothetical protein